MAKARAMNLKKKTDTRSDIPGERMYIDVTGPFNASLGGSKYWMQAVDDATRMGFVYFMRTRVEVREKVGLLIAQVKCLGLNIKIIRCDNAGENNKHLGDIALENQIQVEFTSPYTPQMNRVVERRIAVLKTRSQAMLNQADLSIGLRNKLWAEAVRCANLLENISLTRFRADPPYQQFLKKPCTLYPHLIEFGR